MDLKKYIVFLIMLIGFLGLILFYMFELSSERASWTEKEFNLEEYKKIDYHLIDEKKHGKNPKKSFKDPAKKDVVVYDRFVHTLIYINFGIKKHGELSLVDVVEKEDHILVLVHEKETGNTEKTQQTMMIEIQKNKKPIYIKKTIETFSDQQEKDLERKDIFVYEIVSEGNDKAALARELKKAGNKGEFEIDKSDTLSYRNGNKIRAIITLGKNETNKNIVIDSIEENEKLFIIHAKAREVKAEKGEFYPFVVIEFEGRRKEKSAYTHWFENID